MFRPPAIAILLLTGASLAAAPARAEPLDKESCAKLEAERLTLFDREMKDALVSISLMSPLGQVGERRIEETGFTYRSMGIPKGEVILGGTFLFQRGNGDEIRGRIDEIRRARLAKQPYDLPSAGSVFKNPEFAPAGKLIEEAGLKGLRIGDAQVSEKHANFIVNRGKATAGEVLDLVERVREAVKRETGILLEMEVQVAGENY
jgi:UDP-N-acetylmuramate dehydrogenase